MGISDISRRFKVLGDETRLRLFHLLLSEELSPSEIGEVLNLSQSVVSKQLTALREVLPVVERRDGRRVFLELPREEVAVAEILTLVEPQLAGSEICQRDLTRLSDLRRRSDSGFETPAAGDLGRRYLPGRTWEGFARALLTLVRPGRILDVGVGDGELTLLLASCADSVIGVDPNRHALARLAKKAAERHVDALETRVGEVESLPLEDGSVDLVVVSQVLHLADDPAKGLQECRRVLAPRGRLLLLDLLAHREIWVRAKLEHRWLGFEESDLRTLIEGAGFVDVQVRRVARDRKPPHFITLLGTGTAPESSSRGNE